MAINWSLPVGGSYRMATATQSFMLLGRKYTQPVQARDDSRFCTGVEVVLRRSSTGKEAILSAFMDGILTFYPTAGGGGTLVLDFQRTALRGLDPDRVHRLLYENVDSNSVREKLMKVIETSSTTSPQGDNILRTVSNRETDLTNPNKHLLLKDFVQNAAKVSQFLDDVIIGNQKVYVRAGNEIGEASTYTTEEFPANTSSATQGYDRGVRFIFEDCAGNYINPSLVFVAFANYTISTKNVSIKDRTYQCLSEINLTSDKNSYSHPLISLLQPGGKNAALPDAQITLSNGEKPIVFSAYLSEYHSSFAHKNINVRWKYDLANSLTIAVQNSVIPAVRSSLSNTVDGLWQSSTLRGVLNDLGKLFDIPAELVTAIIAHESDGKNRPARLEMVGGSYLRKKGQVYLDAMLQRKDIRWDITTLTPGEAVARYKEMVKPQIGKGHTSGSIGGFSWEVPLVIDENAKIDVNAPNSLTYKEYFALLDIVQLDQSYFNIRVSPGITQTLIETIRGNIALIQNHPRFKTGEKKTQLANLGLNPLPINARTGSGMFKWLLEKENAIKAGFITLFINRGTVYKNGPTSGFSYFNENYNLSHLDLPVVDAAYNTGHVKPVLTSYTTGKGNPRAVWGMDVLNDVYFKNTIAAYNYLRSTPTLFDQVNCYLKNEAS